MELNREQIVIEIEGHIKALKANNGWWENRGRGGWFNHDILVDALALIKELTDENERLRCENKTLTNDNEELKNKIQEVEFTEEEIDLFDEYTRLLNDGITDAKANNMSEIKTRFAMHFGTYTNKDQVKIADVFRLLDQIAKEMLGSD